MRKVLNLVPSGKEVSIDLEDNKVIDTPDYGSKYVTRVSTLIEYEELGGDYEEESKKVIGHLWGYLLAIPYEIEELYFFYDVISGDMESLYTLLDKMGDTIYNYNNIFYIDRLCIYEEFQRQGYGSKIITHIPEIMADSWGKEVDCMVVYATPLIDNPNDIDKKRVEKFYKNNGFEGVSDVMKVRIDKEYMYKETL